MNIDRTMRRTEPAFRDMTLDILGNVLGRADNPSELGAYLVAELRELTGSRTVMLLQCAHSFGGHGHRIVSVQPDRRRELAAALQVEGLAATLHGARSSQFWDLAAGAETCPAGKALRSLGCSCGVGVPLNVGRTSVGCLLLLDLPDMRHIAEVIESLDMLATIVALVLRCAVLFEQQEAIIDQRTQALRQSEAQHRTLARVAPVGLFHTDPRGMGLYVNEKWREITGLTMDEARGDGWLRSVHRDDRQRVSDAWSGAVANQQPFRLEYRFQRGDGVVTWVLAQAEAETDPAGEVLGYVGTITDITPRKQAEQQRAELEAQLRHSQKMEAIGQLAAGIAHDFNNVLTTIQGNADLLKMMVPPESEQALCADEILRASHRAANMTGQLLAFGRKGKFQTINVPIHEVVNQVVQMLAHSIDRSITIDLDLEADPSAVLGDPAQLQNALLNLGLNARDAMPRGGRLAFATQNTRLDQAYCDRHPMDLAPGDYVEIRVNDTGIGMDAETSSRIFEPFFTTKPSGKGTGLGLAGVYGCVRSHRGTVTVDSTPGAGTTIAILLPLAESSRHAPDVDTPTEPIVGTGHILIVDDEETIRNFADTALRKLGYTVSTCSNGADAVAEYSAHGDEIDLVILDIVMPVMGGAEALDRIRHIDPDARVVISSGFSRDAAADKLLHNGAMAFLSKPFRIDELSHVVARYIKPGDAT